MTTTLRGRVFWVVAAFAALAAFTELWAALYPEVPPPSQLSSLSPPTPSPHSSVSEPRVTPLPEHVISVRTPSPTSAESVTAGMQSVETCEEIMERTGWVLGFDPKTFYKHVQRQMTVGSVSRVEECKWVLDARHLLMPGIEVHSKGGGGVPEGAIGTVQSVGTEVDTIPLSGTVPVKFRRIGGQKTVPSSSVGILLHSLDATFGSVECPVHLTRGHAGDGGAFEFPPRTESRVKLLGSDTASRWTRASYEWCAHPGFFADFCRACGYSCNLLSTWSPERVYMMNVSYPLGGKW
eukprot:Hpha_TRINITY_DN19054_c0_g1::TRINITY_DN19054_c0_g1_i1::g.138460::m.138460